MKLINLGQRTSEIIQIWLSTLSKAQYTEYWSSVEDLQFNEFRSSALSFLQNTFNQTHPYYQEFNQKVIYANPNHVDIWIWILKAVLWEINWGWIFATKDLISAEIFSDFLEMAEYFLQQNYKDAAAVMIGSVLEWHLKHLCEKNDIAVYSEKDWKEIPKKADWLNSELTKKEVYNKIDQKLVTSRLGLRNDAAHGNYDEYTKEQVQNMYLSVLDFITRTS